MYFCLRYIHNYMEALQLNINKIIENKTGRKLAKPVVYLLEKLIHQKEINTFLKEHQNKEGIDFLDAILEKQRISINWINKNKLPSQSRCIFVCNHPLGALDGISIASSLAHIYGDIRYLVNDLLYNITPLQEIFLPVNTLGNQKKETINNIKKAMSSDVAIASFPAGYCSRLIDGKIQDIEWKKSFITQAIEYKRDIVPLYFDGRNSQHFYQIDKWRKKLGIKFDIATILLPDEMFRAKGKTYNIIVGNLIPYTELENIGKNHKEVANKIREISYELQQKHFNLK